MVINDENIQVNDYKVNMLLNNSIENLLDLSISCVDGKVEMIYDISGKQSIEEYCIKEKLKYNEIKLIFEGIVNLNNNLDKYLLDIGHIILDTDCIFFNNNVNSTYFCYYINNKEEFYSSFRKMIQKLVMITSHSDKKAVEFIYGILELCERKDFLLIDIEEYVSSFELEKEKSTEKSTYMDKVDSYSLENNTMKIGYVAESQSETRENITTEKNISRSEETSYIRDMVACENRKLISLSGRGDIIISEYPFVIGKTSGKANGIIKDNSISRLHAKIELINQECYVIEDLNSKNGTYVNDDKLNPYEKVVINIGDKLSFSNFEYIFR